MLKMLASILIAKRMKAISHRLESMLVKIYEQRITELIRIKRP